MLGVGLSLPVADDEAPSDTDIIEGEVVDNEKAQKDAEELFAPEPTGKPVTQQKAVTEVAAGVEKKKAQATTKPDRDTLMAMEFKNEGEMKAVCLKHFKLQPSTVDKETSMFDRANAGQRKQAWQQIVATYYTEQSADEQFASMESAGK